MLCGSGKALLASLAMSAIAHILSQLSNISQLSYDDIIALVPLIDASPVGIQPTHGEFSTACQGIATAIHTTATAGSTSQVHQLWAIAQCLAAMTMPAAPSSSTTHSNVITTASLPDQDSTVGSQQFQADGQPVLLLPIAVASQFVCVVAGAAQHALLKCAQRGAAELAKLHVASGACPYAALAHIAMTAWYAAAAQAGLRVACTAAAAEHAGTTVAQQAAGWMGAAHVATQRLDSAQVPAALQALAVPAGSLVHAQYERVGQAAASIWQCTVLSASAEAHLSAACTRAAAITRDAVQATYSQGGQQALAPASWGDAPDAAGGLPESLVATTRRYALPDCASSAVGMPSRPLGPWNTPPPKPSPTSIALQQALACMMPAVPPGAEDADVLAAVLCAWGVAALMPLVAKQAKAHAGSHRGAVNGNGHLSPWWALALQCQAVLSPTVLAQLPAGHVLPAAGAKRPRADSDVSEQLEEDYSEAEEPNDASSDADSEAGASSAADTAGGAMGRALSAAALEEAAVVAANAWDERVLQAAAHALGSTLASMAASGMYLEGDDAAPHAALRTWQWLLSAAGHSAAQSPTSVDLTAAVSASATLNYVLLHDSLATWLAWATVSCGGSARLEACLLQVQQVYAQVRQLPWYWAACAGACTLLSNAVEPVRGVDPSAAHAAAARLGEACRQVAARAALDIPAGQQVGLAAWCVAQVQAALSAGQPATAQVAAASFHAVVHAMVVHKAEAAGILDMAHSAVSAASHARALKHHPAATASVLRSALDLALTALPYVDSAASAYHSLPLKAWLKSTALQALGLPDQGAKLSLLHLAQQLLELPEFQPDAVRSVILLLRLSEPVALRSASDKYGLQLSQLAESLGQLVVRAERGALQLMDTLQVVEVCAAAGALPAAQAVLLQALPWALEAGQVQSLLALVEVRPQLTAAMVGACVQFMQATLGHDDAKLLTALQSDQDGAPFWKAVQRACVAPGPAPLLGPMCTQLGVLLQYVAVMAAGVDASGTRANQLGAIAAVWSAAYLATADGAAQGIALAQVAAELLVLGSSVSSKATQAIASSLQAGIFATAAGHSGAAADAVRALHALQAESDLDDSPAQALPAVVAQLGAGPELGTIAEALAGLRGALAELAAEPSATLPEQMRLVVQAVVQSSAPTDSALLQLLAAVWSAVDHDDEQQSVAGSDDAASSAGSAVSSLSSASDGAGSSSGSDSDSVNDSEDEDQAGSLRLELSPADAAGGQVSWWLVNAAHSLMKSHQPRATAHTSAAGVILHLAQHLPTAWLLVIAAELIDGLHDVRTTPSVCAVTRLFLAGITLRHDDTATAVLAMYGAALASGLVHAVHVCQADMGPLQHALAGIGMAVAQPRSVPLSAREASGILSAAISALRAAPRLVLTASLTDALRQFFVPQAQVPAVANLCTSLARVLFALVRHRPGVATALIHHVFHVHRLVFRCIVAGSLAGPAVLPFCAEAAAAWTRTALELQRQFPAAVARRYATGVIIDYLMVTPGLAAKSEAVPDQVLQELRQGVLATFALLGPMEYQFVFAQLGDPARQAAFKAYRLVFNKEWAQAK